MSLFKYIDRVKAIHRLIEAERTGTSDEFAARLHVSRSLLMDHLKELKERYNAPIQYSRKRQTFFYSSAFHLQIEIKAMSNIKGGKNISINFPESNSTGLYHSIFAMQAVIASMNGEPSMPKSVSE